MWDIQFFWEWKLYLYLDMCISPCGENKTVMNFQNMMHIAVTVAVVITTISSAFTLAYGYLSQEK